MSPPQPEDVSPLCFDSILYLSESGEVEHLGPEEFIKISLFERVRILLTSSIRFTKNGEPVDTLEALNQLRLMAKAANPGS